MDSVKLFIKKYVLQYTVRRVFCVGGCVGGNDTSGQKRDKSSDFFSKIFNINN